MRAMIDNEPEEQMRCGAMRVDETSRDETRRDEMRIDAMRVGEAIAVERCMSTSGGGRCASGQSVH